MNAQLFCFVMAMMSGSDGFDSLPAERIELACEQAEHLIETVESYGIPPAVFAGLIYVESRWDPNAVSHSNACGLTQVLPRYVDETCEELKDPETSISVGAWSLNMWTRVTVRVEGRSTRVPRPGGIQEALACYNVGHACSDNPRGARYAEDVLRYARQFTRRAAEVETCLEH